MLGLLISQKLELAGLARSGPVNPSEAQKHQKLFSKI